MNLEQRIAFCKSIGLEIEIFENIHDEIVVQAWGWARRMYEWTFTPDGLPIDEIKYNL